MPIGKKSILLNQIKNYKKNKSFNAMSIPQEYKYTNDHEWIKIDEQDNTATVGITDFAQSELGDIVFVEIETKGQTLKAQDIFGTIEAVKTVSDLFLPLGAQIIEINTELATKPELINQDPYGKGWLIKIKINNTNDIQNLLSADEYNAIVH